MVIKRLVRAAKHLLPGYAHLLWHLPGDSNERIKEAVIKAEKGHLGEIRVVIETRRPIHKVLRGETVRDRAVEVFGIERVWDTEKNIGVLLYIQLAERDAEIVADRGLNGVIGEIEWQLICSELERAVGEQGLVNGICRALACIGAVLSERVHCKAEDVKQNELSDDVSVR